MAASAEARGRLRASPADRERAVNVVKAAFVQGLLAKDEFDLRIGQVLAARTYAQLTALTADIPAGLTAVRPLSEPARKSAGKKAVRAWAGVAAAFTGVTTVIAAANGGIDVERLVGVIIFVSLAVIMVAMLVALHAWLDKRTSRQSSQGLPPGAGGEASRRPVSPEMAGLRCPEASGQSIQ
jgi:heme A synthase